MCLGSDRVERVATVHHQLQLYRLQHELSKLSGIIGLFVSWKLKLLGPLQLGYSQHLSPVPGPPQGPMR